MVSIWMKFNLLFKTLGVAGGKFVAASKMNDACKTFGFPFERVKCCRETECKCMEYKEKKWDLKSSSAGEEIKTCMDCHHEKDRHYILEKYGVVYYELLLHFVLTSSYSDVLHQA